jgi:hypothetical protein
VSLVGCSSPGLPSISESDANACTELAAALPESVDGEDLSSDSERSVAWGDIELTCGAELPAAYDDFAACSEVAGVGWFLPPTELRDPGSEIVATALTHTPRVSVLIPPDHRGSDAVLAEISPVIGETLTEHKPCL